MLLAALLALAMAASDSTQTPTDSGGAILQTAPDSMFAPIARQPDGLLNLAAKDSSKTTPPKRTKLQREVAAMGRATVGLVMGLGLAAAILSNSKDACGLGCMGSVSTILMVYGAVILPPVVLYFAGDDIDAQAPIPPERFGIRFAFALDPVLQKIQSRALWQNP